MDRLEQIDRIVGRIGRAPSPAALFETVRDEVRGLGFERFCYRKVSNPDGSSSTFCESNYPTAWGDHYRGQDYRNDDAVTLHSLRSLRPFSWHGLTTHQQLTATQQRVFDEAAAFDLKAGAAVSIGGQVSGRGTLFVASGMTHRAFEGLFAAHRHELHLIAIYAHERANELIGQAPAAFMVGLTLRETEVLKWTVKGKTSWEIAQILMVSEPTIKEHVRNICRKFGVRSKTHAAALAIRHGYVAP